MKVIFNVQKTPGGILIPANNEKHGTLRLTGDDAPDRIQLMGPDNLFRDLLPGDLMWWYAEKHTAENPQYEWALACPHCGRVSFLKNSFEVRENKNLTYSIRPSIKCPVPGCKADFIVDENRIKWVKHESLENKN